MSARTKTVLGMTAVVLLVAGVAWASGEPVEANTVERTVIPVDPAGEVTLEVVSAGLSITTIEPEPGWTVTVETSVGREVEARFDSDEGRIDFEAELEDGEIRVEIERRLAEASTTTTIVTSSSTSSSSTSSTTSPAPSTTSTSLEDGGTTSTSISSPSTSSTVAESTSTTRPDGSTTSTSLPRGGGTTSTTIDDDVVDVPDGTRRFEAGPAGSITIDVRSGSLSLTSVDARSGWSYEIDKARSDDIEVELSQGDSEVEIRVRIHHGRLEVRVDD